MKRQKPFIIASMTPCVHCGSAFNYMVCHGSVRQDGMPFNLIYQVTCKKCRACGPLAKTAEEAVKGWEHRAEPMLNEPPPPDLPALEFDEEEFSSEREWTANHEGLVAEQGASEEILRRRKAAG